MIMTRFLTTTRGAALAMAGMFAMSTPSPASLRDKPDVFFKPGPDAPKHLPAGRLYPQGKRFPFSLTSPPEGWDAGQKAEYQRLGVVHFNPAKIVQPDQERSKEGEQGPDIGTSIGLVRAPGTESAPGEIIFSDKEEVTNTLAAQVKAAAENPKISFWNLLPGEIRFRDKREKEYLATASRAIGQNDPLKRPVWIYLPPEASTAYLSHIAPWVDYLGKALEPDGVALDRSRIWFRWAMERAVEAIHETSAEATPVAVLVNPQSLSADERNKIATTLRHDLYLSLVTGAKGVISIASKQPADLPTQEAFRSAGLDIARELLGPKKLGELFLFGERRDEIEVDIVDGPAEVEVHYPSGGVETPMAYSSVSHLDLAYGKERYLILVNSAMEPVTLMIGGMPYAAVRAESLFESLPPMDIAEGEFETDLQPLEVRIYRMTRR